MNLREVKLSDYNNICKVVYNNNLDIYDFKSWQDIWLLNPYYKKIKNEWTKGWVLEHKKKIVGYFGSFPMLYDFLGKEYIVAVATCWVVENKFRNYSMLLIEAYFKQKNVDVFLSSTANETGSHVFKAFQGNNINFKEYNENLLFIFNHFKLIKNFKIVKKLKFIFFVLKPIINFFSFIINFYYFITVKNINNNIVIYESFNDEFDYFWNKLKKNKNTFNFKRNKEWLNWHFNYYIKNNKIYIITEKNNNKITSYCILIEKNNDKLQLKKLCLVDLISLNDNNNNYKKLIKFSIKLAKQKKYDYLEIVGFNSNKRKIIKKFFPFYRKFKHSRYCYYTSNDFLLKSLKNSKNLDFSMIDGDAIM